MATGNVPVGRQPSMRRKYNMPHGKDQFPCRCAYCLSQYNQHNPGSLLSPDSMVRMHGKCGCLDCADTRKTWQVTGVPPNMVMQSDGSYTINFQPAEDTRMVSPQRYEVSASYGKSMGGNSMAGIKVCERAECETFMLGKAAGWIQFVGNPQDDPTLIEVCPGCVAEFLQWKDHAPIGERPKSYKEPYTEPEPETDSVQKATAEQLAAALFEKLMKTQTDQTKAIGDGKTQES